jgi:CBS domain-containing protein
VSALTDVLLGAAVVVLLTVLTGWYTAVDRSRLRVRAAPVLTLAADEPAHAAMRTMRERRSHLALARDGGTAGALVGLLTLHDLLDRLLPRPEVAALPRRAYGGVQFSNR